MKKFDQKLYDNNDQRAKDEAIKILNELNASDEFPSSVFRNRNKYDVDLIVKNGDKVMCYVEVEVKNVWIGDKFPYPNVQFPKRKAKYVKNKKKPVIFMMFNRDLSNFLMVHGEDVVNAPLVEVSNKYVAKNEFFFQVPLERASMKKDIEQEVKDQCEQKTLETENLID